MPRVLQKIDDPVLLILEKNGFAVSHQVRPESDENVRQPAAHFALQKPKHAADLLQRKSLAPQLGNYRDFNYFFRQVNALVALVARRNHLPLVPPLKLPQAYLCDLRDIGARERSLRGALIGAPKCGVVA